MQQITTDHSYFEVFRTVGGAVFQSNKANRYILEFHHYRCSFKPGDFLHFKNQILALDIAGMLQSTSKGGDIALLMPHYTDCCFVLTVANVIELTELLNGATCMLQLNSFITECLHLSVA